MSCVDELTAERAARKDALGRIGSLRKSIPFFKIRIGDDWLFGFIKTKFNHDSFQISVKLSYIDCKGVALEKIPPEIEQKLKKYIVENIASLLERELSSLV